MQLSFDRRESGSLCHLTSLPKPLRGAYFGADLGPAARAFVDWLVLAGQRWWQLLPYGPPGKHGSPYDSPSAFAGSPFLISPDDLHEQGWLTRAELRSAAGAQSGTTASQGQATRMALLRLAFKRFQTDTNWRERLEADCEAHAHWLPDYALFRALSSQQGMPWWRWPRQLRERHTGTLGAARANLSHEIDFQRFQQWCFERGARALRGYAGERGVRLLGDVPIYVAHDSADVWRHRALFKLDPQGIPTWVAGAPADAFNQAGQLWGNPVYTWAKHAASGFDWWLHRLARGLEHCDALRLDHFIGYVHCWEVRHGATTAAQGRFRPVPGRELLTAARARFGGLPFIAEDLGKLTPEVEQLRDEFGLLGMRILQFGFSGEDPQHLPHNYPRHCLAMTGTHDTNTMMGWVAALSGGRHSSPRAQEERRLRHYLGRESDEDLQGALLRSALGSVANLCILPVQDVLGLGAEARMNVPGTSSGNWQWALRPGQLARQHAESLRRLSAAYGRVAATD